MTSGLSHATWEYLVIPESDREKLSALGLEGWELVTSSGDRAERWLYFKRQAPGFRERVTLEQRATYYSAHEIDLATASGLGE